MFHIEKGGRRGEGRIVKDMIRKPATYKHNRLKFRFCSKFQELMYPLEITGSWLTKSN